MIINKKYMIHGILFVLLFCASMLMPLADAHAKKSTASSPQPRYLRFLRYSELMSLPKAKQLAYIAGIQKIFADLVKANPEFAWVSPEEKDPAFLQMLEYVLQKNLQKYPQMLRLIEEARANQTATRPYKIPILNAEQQKENQTNNPNEVFNQLTRIFFKIRPQCAGEIQVDGKKVSAELQEHTFRGRTFFSCKYGNFESAPKCPSGYLAISSGEISDQKQLYSCIREIAESDRLLPMQPGDTDPLKPSAPQAGPNLIPPTKPTRPPRPEHGRRSARQGGIDGSTAAAPPAAPPAAAPSAPAAKPQPTAPEAAPTPPQETETPPASPSSDSKLDRTDYTSGSSETSVKEFPNQCDKETYVCPFGDDAREASRDEFEKNLSDRSNRCLNGGNVSTYNATARKCARVSSKDIGGKTYSCTGNRTLCNPMIFGLQNDDSAICVALQMNVTVACTEVAKDLSGGDPAANALKFLKSHPEVADAWNKWGQSMEQMCQPKSDKASHQFHCTECTLIFSNLQKMNALTGLTSPCGTAYNSLGERDPMVVNGMIKKTLSEVTGSQAPTAAPTREGKK